jgi:monoamine oxidase
MQDHFDVAIVGAGAAGLAAAARLAGLPLSFVVLEARARIGGRALTVRSDAGLPLDRGCGWLHSADRNPLVPLIEKAGFTIDRTPPAWERQAANLGFPPEEQRQFGRAYAAFEERMEAAAETGEDRPGAELFDPTCRWNPLIDAVSSYYNGVEYEAVSVLDYAAYQDTNINWRVAEGYGAALAALAPAGAFLAECPISRIGHDGHGVRLDTPRGTLTARTAIVTVPTPHIAQERLVFSPFLPEKLEAAAGLPLGLANKVFLSLAEPEAFPKDQHLFGKIDRTETGSYHLRPFGRPYIEVFLGGRHACLLEEQGQGAAADFASEELAGLLGSGVRATMTPMGETRWAADPFALGSYSHATPGHSRARQALAAPVGDRLFFAGEATSAHFYSTAHGAWGTGLRAADEAIAALSFG